MEYPSYLNNLIESLKVFPGIGSKSATRMAFQMLEMDEESIDQIAKSFTSLTSSINYCKVCHSISDNDICSICNDETRDHNQICVVSNYKDIFAIEKMNNYNGVYHVLNGDIAINKGITPDKLNIDTLVSKLNKDIKEIILATNPTIQGETTALYLSKVLADYDVNVTRIANGMPIGANIDYIDELTMLKAFENRRTFNK
ncbi:recombination mediator RecR [Mycoplasma sp. P36-A1]|uniref:recombination mediator RecR n=1 Tax=Mycoplasma sp. P36-A1 TaxID=3252900 RepID=UPI003C2B3427